MTKRVVEILATVAPSGASQDCHKDWLHCLSMKPTKGGTTTGGTAITRNLWMCDQHRGHSATSRRQACHVVQWRQGCATATRGSDMLMTHSRAALSS